MKVEFRRLQELLGKAVDDPAVLELVGGGPSRLERIANQGFVELKGEGLDLVLKEAPWVLPAAEISDAKRLHLAAIHFHREGHEGYARYRGQFPLGIAFGDTEPEVRAKLGEPSTTGGGGMSKVLKKPIPRWLRYPLEGALLHLQFDAEGRLEMVTAHVREQAP